MDPIPPIAPRSRFEPPLAPTRLAPVSRERREPSGEERKPPSREPSGEQSGPDDEGDGTPHIDVHA